MRAASLAEAPKARRRQGRLGHRAQESQTPSMSRIVVGTAGGASPCRLRPIVYSGSCHPELSQPAFECCILSASPEGCTPTGPTLVPCRACHAIHIRNHNPAPRSRLTAIERRDLNSSGTKGVDMTTSVAVAGNREGS